LTISPSRVWLRYCGTVRKPGGNRENKPQPGASEETGILYSIFWELSTRLKVYLINNNLENKTDHKKGFPSDVLKLWKKDYTYISGGVRIIKILSP